MKINIEVELPDGDDCRGCPCNQTNYTFTEGWMSDCGLGYFKDKPQDGIVYTRPEICKEQNKEIVK